MAKMLHRRTAIATAIAAGALAAPMQVWAKGTYPAEPANRIVVPFAAGGTADCLGHLVAQILSRIDGLALRHRELERDGRQPECRDRGQGPA